ncbi:MAG: hypothetical protein Q9165_007899 [Trypethelium subeluteriae]
MPLASLPNVPSDPDWARSFTGTKDIPYYIDNIDDKIVPEIQKLLVEYSGVSPEDVRQHIYDIRDKAWAIRSYPCTGIGIWLKPNLPKFPIYPRLLEILKHGGSLLDVGCFIGHDLRRLAFDGAPSDRIFAVDIVNHWELGYEMFRDADRFSAHFVEADILHPNQSLEAMKQTLDVITMLSLLHQWDWDGQVFALQEVAALLRPIAGSLAVGYQVGTVGQNLIPASALAKTDCYWHNPETLSKMWDQVGERTGSKWICESEMKTWEEMGWEPKDTEYLGQDARMILWVAKRSE